MTALKDLMELVENNLLATIILCSIGAWVLKLIFLQKDPDE